MKKIIYLLLSLISASLTLSVMAEEPLFKVETSKDKLPREFYDLDERLYGPDSKRPYEVVLVLANDLGVGDDYGHTHQLKIVGVTKLKNGIRLRFSYSTDLYTEKIGEEYAEGLTPQHFMDESIGKFMADNIESGNFFYWKGEAGWNQLSDDNTANVLRGSTQQIFFHKIINPFLPQKQPLNVSDGFGTKNGIMVGASGGLQKNFQLGSLHLRPQAEVGISKSTISTTDHAYASASLESTYIINPRYKASLIAESQALRHLTGTQLSHSLNANLESKNWVVGAGVYLNRGTLDNHMRYNKPNNEGKIDPMYMIYGSFRFGRGSSGQPNILKPKDIFSK
jgi:hypothetical protein